MTPTTGSPVLAQPVATATRGTPTIDGEIDEVWRHAQPVLIKQQINLQAGAEPTETFARARFLWDQQHLYVLWHVADAEIHSSHGDSWQRDSVELFVDENHRRTSSYENDDAQYRAGADGTKSGGKNFFADNFAVAAKQVVSGYRIEASVRFRTIQGAEGAELGLELQVNDDAGAGYREAVVKWADPTDNSWFDTSRFGTLKLVGKVDHDATDPQRDMLPPGTPLPFLERPRTEQNGAGENRESKGPDPGRRIPEWAADAVFYQIFPERFCNGDASNDPTRESLEFVDIMPDTWQITPWTSDWYARAAWEREMGDDFYEDGVFHRRYGGDLQGVLDRLDYLGELGINTIYFNPVFYARSLHKYDGNSYHHVDPYFGPDPAGDLRKMATETSDPDTWVWTAADKLFLKVVSEAHRRGIRVIIDGVFNHTGRDFFAFADLRENQQQSPYVDWYMVEQFEDPTTEATEFKYVCWWGVDTLPEFADNPEGTDLHPGPKQYIFDATSRWMDPNSDGDPVDGIDGWRLDVANDVPDGFWRDWHDHVRGLNPSAYTVAEIWDDASDYLRRCGFSATMNYHGFAFLVKGFLLDGQMPADQFVAELQRRANEHPWEGQLALQNLIDSHDTDRVASMIVNQPAGEYRQDDRFDYDVGEEVSPRQTGDYQVRQPNRRERHIQKLATLFQLTYVGAPMIYYGSEAGMWGADDPDDRKPMVWPDLSYEPESHDPLGRPREEDEVRFDEQLFRYYQQLIALRHQHEPLRRGKFQPLVADARSQLVIFARTLGGETILVGLNRGEASTRHTVDLAPFRGQATPRLLITTGDQPPRFEHTLGRLELVFPPLSGCVIALSAGELP